MWVDALTQKVREGGRALGGHALIATGVNADWQSEIVAVYVV
jgi:transposase-like protein